MFQTCAYCIKPKNHKLLVSFFKMFHCRAYWHYLNIWMSKAQPHLVQIPFRYNQCSVQSLFSQLDEYFVPWSWGSFVNPTVEEGEGREVHEAPFRWKTCPFLQSFLLLYLVLHSQAILLTYALHSHWAIPILRLIKQNQLSALNDLMKFYHLIQ